MDENYRGDRGMIKIAFFDIDGTLVSFKTHKVPSSAVKAIEQLRAKGVKVFIATGRHRATINNLGNLEFDGYITMNGAYCYAGNEVIFKLPIPKSDVDRFIELQRKEMSFPTFFLTEHKLFANFFNADTEELIKLINFPTPPLASIDTIAKQDIYQMVSFFDKLKDSQVMSRLPNCSDARWYPTFTDIVHKDASKMVGIQKVLDYYGLLPEQAIAFGDGGNDIPMLRAVKYSVAMGNADESVKAIAAYITSSVDDDGIFNALKYYSMI